MEGEGGSTSDSINRFQATSGGAGNEMSDTDSDSTEYTSSSDEETAW